MLVMECCLLFMPGMSKAASATAAFVEIIDHFEVGLYHGNEYQLRNTVTLFDAETVAAAVPAGNK